MSAARERILEARIAELETRLIAAKHARTPAGFFQGETLHPPETGPPVQMSDPGTMVPDTTSHVGRWALALWRSKFTGRQHGEPDGKSLVSFLQRNLRRKLK